MRGSFKKFTKISGGPQGSCRSFGLLSHEGFIKTSIFFNKKTFLRDTKMSWAPSVLADRFGLIHAEVHKGLKNVLNKQNFKVQKSRGAPWVLSDRSVRRVHKKKILKHFLVQKSRGTPSVLADRSVGLIHAEDHNGS